MEIKVNVGMQSGIEDIYNVQLTTPGKDNISYSHNYDLLALDLLAIKEDYKGQCEGLVIEIDEMARKSMGETKVKVLEGIVKDQDRMIRARNIL